MTEGVFNSFSGEEYDRLQPIRIEMYRFYHDLAFDFVPFEADQEFRFDLGCGTGTFQRTILEHFPGAQCLALDYSEQMLSYAEKMAEGFSDRVAFRQADLNAGIPDDVGSFQMVCSFSAIHHLTDENKERLFQQIYRVLVLEGWFLYVDAMRIRFDDDEFCLGKRRFSSKLSERYAEAGIDPDAEEQVSELIRNLSDDSPERDRIGSFESQVESLKKAGFKSVDHVWHFWMEHFVVARR